jgi:soluble lytic murein transglycosylase-like protein
VSAAAPPRRLLLVFPVLLVASACGGPAGDAAGDAAPATGSTAPPTSTATAATPTTAADTTTALAVSTSASTEPMPDPDRPMPGDAATAAADLVEAERAIRDPEVGPDEAAAWGRRQQRLYRLLASHPDWAEEALALDTEVNAAIRSNWEARVALDALVASEGPHPELPAWRVVEPRPVDELLGYYRAGEERWGIDWTYLAAINLIETRMGRIEGLSSAGAVGPMQFLPSTWADCCEGDPTDPADAIPGAAHYLTIRGGPGDMARAIWGYNNSERYVTAVSAYAEVMAADELAYRGYHAWDIFFRSTEGLVVIPVGYEEAEPVPAAEWLAANPEARLTG